MGVEGKDQLLLFALAGGSRACQLIILFLFTINKGKPLEIITAFHLVYLYQQGWLEKEYNRDDTHLSTIIVIETEIFPNYSV